MGFLGGELGFEMWRTCSTNRSRACAWIGVLLVVHALPPLATSQNFGSTQAVRLPSEWKKLRLEAAGLELAVPDSFQRLPGRRFTPIRMQGRLDGSPVLLSVTWLKKNFATVSRTILPLASDARIRSVRAFRLGDHVAAILERMTSEPKRQRLTLVVCPRNEALRVEVSVPPQAPYATMQSARSLLELVRLTKRKGLTVVTADEESRKKADIARGFTEDDLKDIQVRESAHYRLFTTATADATLLEILESELLPRVTAICGVKPSTKRLLPIFVHRRRSGYVLATMRLGLSAQQVEAMEGHSWDRYYATYYSGPRAPVHMHEGVHQYVTATLGLDGGGPWLQEGFARWIETQYSKERPARNARNLARARKTFPSLEELVRTRSFLLGGGRRYGLDALELYDISASFVRYLAQEHRAKFRRVFLRCGVLPSGQFHLVKEALEDTLGISFQKLEADWRRWLREDV